MSTARFEIRGSDGKTVLYENDSCNACVMWGTEYTISGDFGGWDCLFLYEVAEDGEWLVSTLEPATCDRPKEWVDNE